MGGSALPQQAADGIRKTAVSCAIHYITAQHHTAPQQHSNTHNSTAPHHPNTPPPPSQNPTQHHRTTHHSTTHHSTAQHHTSQHHTSPQITAIHITTQQHTSQHRHLHDCLGFLLASTCSLSLQSGCTDGSLFPNLPCITQQWPSASCVGTPSTGPLQQ